MGQRRIGLCDLGGILKYQLYIYNLLSSAPGPLSIQNDRRKYTMPGLLKHGKSSK